MAEAIARRETLESIALGAFGVIGVAVGLLGFKPAPVIAAPSPSIAPPVGGWPQLPAHADNVVQYTLEAKLDPGAHAIDGKGTITLRNTSGVVLNDLRLHLYLNAFKNNETIFRRARIGGFRGDRNGAAGFVDVKRFAIKGGDDLWPKHEFVSHRGETPQDPFSAFTKTDVADDETDVRIPLPTPLAAGASMTFEVEFHDQLPEVSERTGYHESFHFAGQWFPKLARLENGGKWASFPFHHLAEFYADYGAFDVTIDVPEAFTIGASGPLIDSKVVNGRRIERHTVEDVHDFAWTAWDKFVVRDEKLEGVAVRFLSPPGYEPAIDREVISLQHAMRDKNARFGAYPYPVLTVVHPPDGADEAGGMEYPTLITTGGPWWPNHGGHEVEFVTIHEFGHQWFYGLIGTHEVEWPSGDEGFNSFGDEVAFESLFPGGGAISLGPLQINTWIFMRRGVDGAFDEPIFQPAYKFASGRSYGGRVYGATAMVLQTLRRTYGPSLDTAMGVYARKFRFQHPRPDDFFEVLRAEVGPECEMAARTALTTSFSYDVYVESISAARDKGPVGFFDGKDGRQKKEAKTDGGWNNATWIGRRGALDLSVDVELRFADGKRERRSIRFGPPAVVLPRGDMPLNPLSPLSPGGDDGPPVPSSTNGNWFRIDADGPSELVSVIVDPDFKLLIDRNRLNNFTSSKRGGAPIARERAQAWIAILSRMVGP